MMVGRPSLSSAASAASAATNKSPDAMRGRAAGSSSGTTAGLSRATSTSTGSVSGKRSTLSAEDAQHQKLRGKEIYKQDNSLPGNREREQRDRENSARLAREQAAERSRQLSREWAEKQRLKKLAALAQVSVEQATSLA